MTSLSEVLVRLIIGSLSHSQTEFGRYIPWSSSALHFYIRTVQQGYKEGHYLRVDEVEAIVGGVCVDEFPRIYNLHIPARVFIDVAIGG